MKVRIVVDGKTLANNVEMEEGRFTATVVTRKGVNVVMRKGVLTPIPVRLVAWGLSPVPFLKLETIEGLTMARIDRDPYACPLAAPSIGRPCPNRVYPDVFKNAPQAMRAAQHRSRCRRAGECYSTEDREPLP